MAVNQRCCKTRCNCADNYILCTLDKVTTAFLIIGTCLISSASWSIFVFTMRQMCTSRDVVLQTLGTNTPGLPQIGPPQQPPSPSQKPQPLIRCLHTGRSRYPLDWLVIGGVELPSAMVPPVCSVPPSIDVLKGLGQRSGLQRLGQTPAHEYGSWRGSANHLVHPIGSKANVPAERGHNISIITVDFSCVGKCSNTCRAHPPTQRLTETKWIKPLLSSL